VTCCERNWAKAKTTVRYVFYAVLLCSVWVHVLIRLKGFQELTSVDDAQQKFFNAVEIETLKTVAVPLHSALNRVLAQEIVADMDLPRSDRSAVDGYAVKAQDTIGANQFSPKTFEIIDKDVVKSKQTMQVWTGSLIPKGANAVVMLEDIKRTGHKIGVWSPTTPGQNVSKKGEDIQKGEIALERGTRLKPQHLGLLAALGIVKFRVFEKPRIAILATGNELAQVGSKLQENQVFDVNRIVLSAMCRQLGAEPLDLGTARDDADEISRKIKLGLVRAGLVITSGGTSVGGSDLVPEAVNRIGKPGIVVHGVAMRPAMPTALAAIDGKPIVILPGNPVAAMVGFEVFARPLVCRMLGLEHAEPRFVTQARMNRRIATTLGRRTFVRVHVFEKGGEFLAEPISARGSSLISTMTKANGYVVAPENREGLEKGELVSVQLFDNI
jgi:molybdopterin molybdotransferase